MYNICVSMYHIYSFLDSTCLQYFI